MITPIFTGPFRNLKHGGYVYAQKRAIYDAFWKRVHHHHLINIQPVIIGNIMSEKEFFLSQQEIADQFGVDRTTVRAWTKRGLPFIEGDKGKPGRYQLGHVLFWVRGQEGLKELGMTGELHPLDCIMHSREIMLSMVGEEEDKQEYEKKFNKGLEIYGYSPDEIAQARGRAQGIEIGRELTLRRLKKHTNENKKKRKLIRQNAT